MDLLQNYTDKIVELVLVYGPKLLLAVITLIIGLWVIKIFLRTLRKTMEKGKVDASLRHFLISLLGVLLKVMLVISVASMIGIQMTSFVAVLGAAGLAIGLAMQGSLANFAGGVLILMFKPFKIGDYIESQGYDGHVRGIDIINTTLETLDGKTVIIPNGALSNSDIVNYTANSPIRRVDMMFGIGYGDDLKKAKAVLEKIAPDDKRVVKNPAPYVAVAELGDNSVNFTMRVWCHNDDYWTLYFDMHERVKLAFDEAGISIPFPQRDVHVYNHREA